MSFDVIKDMETKRVVYQVWMHRGQESAVHLVDTCQNEQLALKVAGQHNAAERHDTRPDLPPRRYYYVKPVSEEQIREAEKEKYRLRRGEERRRLTRRHHEVLAPIAREMAAAMVFCLETTDKERLALLRNRGGWIEAYRGFAEGVGSITCSALYTGWGEMALEVTIEDANESLEVETFRTEYAMRSWLLNTRGSASAIENRLIDMVCDLEYSHKHREGMEQEE